MNEGEEKELEDILTKYRNRSDEGKVPGKLYANPTTKTSKKEDEYGGGDGQWSSRDGIRFFPSGKSYKELSPGVYDIQESQHGIYFNKIRLSTEKLIRFPDATSDKVISEIQKFWDSKSLFVERPNGVSILYKRGVILFGSAGCGKSISLKLIVQDVVNRGGVGIVFGNSELFLQGMRILREIQPTTKVVVLMEDIDNIIYRNSESEVLNLLDGVNTFEDVVFLATTNHPGRLGPRIINRPSRFDKRFKIGYPDETCRKMYLEHLLAKEDIEKHGIDINQWVVDSKDFSFAHLKELFTAVVMLGNTYKDAIATLKKMRENLKDEEGPKNSVGFVKEEW